MKVRIASVDELNFLKCFKHKLWGANKMSQNNWDIGDKVVFKIKDKLVGLATVSGTPFVDDMVIWDNGLYWSRIPLEFDCVLRLDEAIDFNGRLKELFLKEWGTQYGWVVLNKKELPEHISMEILAEFSKTSNQFKYFEENIDKLLEIKKTKI